eukprot:m.6012 g.6012  ORF g.6012 m.6012 type:complete len:67 (+) comp4839_c1_seq1:92-292(+)
MSKIPLAGVTSQDKIMGASPTRRNAKISTMYNHNGPYWYVLSKIAQIRVTANIGIQILILSSTVRD